MLHESAKSQLQDWLASHDGNLQRFSELIALSTLATETGLEPDHLRTILSAAEAPIYHVWPHTHAGKTRATKPYCLRLAGGDTVCLEWEDSVVAAAEAEFQRFGYTTCRELGADDHIRCLIEEPDVRRMTAGVNLRDLWAHRREGNHIDFWIIEAKGKEAGSFDRYCFAEALSQIFEIPAEPLTALLGTRRRASHGLCYRIAEQLLLGWQRKGWQATVTLAVLVPRWTPDVTWDSGRPKPRPTPYYQRPCDEFTEFINNGISRSRSPTRGEAIFAQILEHLESQYSIRTLAQATKNLRFRMLTTGNDPTTGKFALQGFPRLD
jgi:hypothetical protein